MQENALFSGKYTDGTNFTQMTNSNSDVDVDVDVDVYVDIDVDIDADADADANVNVGAHALCFLSSLQTLFYRLWKVTSCNGVLSPR